MISIHFFTFNPIGENTYILYDETKECVIIDPGCYDERERNELAGFIDKNQLKPVKLLNTHCHLDHVFGNAFVSEKYNLKLEAHLLEVSVLDAFLRSAAMYGLNATPSPDISKFLKEGDTVEFGKSVLEIAFTPGHSPGSITFYNKEQQFIIAGDVLFQGSVGRSDLPGGDHQTLLDSIRTKLLSLGDAFKVYSGHGPSTTIGYERLNNPFLV